MTTDTKINETVTRYLSNLVRIPAIVIPEINDNPNK